MYQSKIENFRIRFAEESDIDIIYHFIIELAKYEKVVHWVEATKESIFESLFQRKNAEVLIGEYDGKPISFAVFYNTFSTLVGKPGLHLDDLFVEEEYRGKGIGKMMLAYLAHLAQERHCGRFEWWCFIDNIPSLNFYKHNIGASEREELVVFRLKEQGIKELANKI